MSQLHVEIKINDKFESFEYEGDLHIPVTTLINRINHQNSINIDFSSSCLQGLCGACAMVINSTPKLACITFVDEEIMTKEYNRITIEPLSKFPQISDLKVDRSHLFNSLKDTNQWLEGKASAGDVEFEYEMSLCLMCGCCVEACPNFNGFDEFFGTPLAVSSAKLTSIENNEKIKDSYNKHFYPNCLKALACEDICPMGIKTQRAISKMNRKVMWRLKYGI